MENIYQTRWKAAQFILLSYDKIEKLELAHFNKFPAIGVSENHIKAETNPLLL